MNLMNNRTFWVLIFATSLFVFPLFSAVSKEDTVKYEFTSTPVPDQIETILKPFSQSKLRISYPDGSRNEFPLSYHFLFQSGDIIGGGTPAGGIVDHTGQVIEKWNRSFQGERIRNGPINASGPDGNTLMQFSKSPMKNLNNHVFQLITHFEHHTWVENLDPDRFPVNVEDSLPMVINRTLLEQNSETGHLSPFSLKNIDTRDVGGVWLPCASTLTPWSTHLGSEEYEPDAKWYEDRPLETMNLFLKTPGKVSSQGGANPYQYGFPVEVVSVPDGTPRAIKRYAMGRISLEMVEIMPDQRTAYMTDDAIDGVRLMFIADRTEDLSSGTLYAAEWIQSGTNGREQSNLQWIRLGHTNEKTIESFIENSISFSDIFEERPFFFSIRDKKLFNEFQLIYVFHGHKPEEENFSIKTIDTKALSMLGPEYFAFMKVRNDKAEFLKVKPGMETAAAFLETRRFAALKGATTEFTKMEGQAFNKRDKKLYTAVSSVKEGMLMGYNPPRFRNHIQLSGKPEDLRCGIIFESDLKAGIQDTEGNRIDSDWVAVNMTPMLAGKSSSKNSKMCEWNSIANPDNIQYSETMHTLFIAEDSGDNHPADFLWAYSLESGELNRILVGPKDYELTGLDVVDDYNGFSYILGSFQRGLDSETILGIKNPRKANEYVASQDVRGIVGYLEPIPLKWKREH